MCLTQMSHKSTPIGEQSAWRQRRLKNELNAIKSDAPEGIKVNELMVKFYNIQYYRISASTAHVSTAIIL